MLLARHGSARGSDHYCKGTLNHAGIGAPEICRRRIVHLVQVAAGVVQKRAKKLIGGLLASRNCEAARLDPWSYEPKVQYLRNTSGALEGPP